MVLPHLAPRPSPRHSLQPLHDDGFPDLFPDMLEREPSPPSVQNLAPARRPSSSLASPLSLSAPLSPRPVLSPCNRTNAVLALSPPPPPNCAERISTPKAASLDGGGSGSDTTLSPLDGSFCGSDYSLTPPASGPRPLVVSAKRHGQDVRRKHSKRRRCRTRRNKKNNSNAGNLSPKPNGLTLWNDDTVKKPRPVDSSDEEDNCSELPFLFTKPLSPMEKKKQYWEYCYGPTMTPADDTSTSLASANLPPHPSSWSAKRAPPLKSCLSLSKPPQPNETIRTPPSSQKNEYETEVATVRRKKKIRVQFGSPQAVEYEVDNPPGQLTPLPNDVTRERYPMEQKAATEAEEELTEETKQNSALLAEWDDGFDSRESAAARRRKNRRSSSLFTPSPIVKKDDSDDDDDSDGGGDDDDDDGIPLPFIEPQLEATIPPSAPSPSSLVMKDLAALSMSPASSPDIPKSLSPKRSLDVGAPMSSPKRTHYNRENFSWQWKDSPPEKEERLALEMSHTNNNNTTEFMVCLDSIHAAGGAMDMTPVKSNFGERTLTTTPPPTNVSLESIHSVGGALDLHFDDDDEQSITNRLESKPSPLAMSSMVQDDAVKSPECFGPTENITQVILNDPSADQEWGCSIVLHNLQRQHQNVLNQVITDALQFSGLERCVNDFVDSTKITDGLKFPSLDDHNNQNKNVMSCINAITLKHKVETELLVLETRLMESLCSKLEEETEKAMRSVQFALVEPPAVPVSHQRNQKNIDRLEKEIAALEKELSHEKNTLCLSEAAIAPYSLLQCQASCHTSSFRMVEFNGEELRICFDHVIEGITTQVVFDLELDDVKMSDSHNAASTTSNDNEAALKFHQFFRQKISGPHFAAQLHSCDLQGSILLLSTWFGRLNLATMDIFKMSDQYEVIVDLPEIYIQISATKRIQVVYDSNRFIPSQVILVNEESGTKEVIKTAEENASFSSCLQTTCEHILCSSASN